MLKVESSQASGYGNHICAGRTTVDLTVTTAGINLLQRIPNKPGEAEGPGYAIATSPSAWPFVQMILLRRFQ